jgi:hypothetical protein
MYTKGFTYVHMKTNHEPTSGSFLCCQSPPSLKRNYQNDDRKTGWKIEGRDLTSDTPGGQ